MPTMHREDQEIMQHPDVLPQGSGSHQGDNFELYTNTHMNVSLAF